MQNKLWALALSACLTSGCTHQNTLSLFPLDHYDQSTATWIKPTAAHYDQPLVDAHFQQQRFHEFYEHYFGTWSPWNKTYIKILLQQAAPNDLSTLEQQRIQNLSNIGKTPKHISYGENFLPYSSTWLANIVANINFISLRTLSYQANHRGIAIDNLSARVLPTDDVHFYHHQLAGQGFPFDNLQVSALWVGTPVYVLTETRDHAWSLVLTPDYIAWVKSNGIARTNQRFVTTWQNQAKKHMAAITQTQTSVVDEQGLFRFSAYIGTVFPAKENQQLFIPVMNTQKQAEIRYSSFTRDQAILMPETLTPHHVAQLINRLIGRAYGWGNLYFYNDCSAELKNLYTPFGIWLPRNSITQRNAGQMVDMTWASSTQRLHYLLAHGRPLLTLIYLGGHVVLYVGQVPNPNSPQHESIAMTYQNIWGLSPISDNHRAVIGKAVWLPMLLQYPEDPNLNSLANKKYFQIIYLDTLPNKQAQTHPFNLHNFM